MADTDLARGERAIFSKVTLSLLVALALIRLLPHMVSDSNFWAASRPLYRAALNHQVRPSDQCADLNTEVLSRYTDVQRLIMGSALTSMACMDSAALVLPELTPASDRLGLLAYQWGLNAWAQGDLRRAATLWRQGEAIDRHLLFRARQSEMSHFDQARVWYEAAIMAAGSPQMLAESITAYSEESRGRMAAEAFRERLSYLESYFAADTAVGYRLRGEYSLRGGSYQAAFEQLSQSIALGFDDAETWYLLGDAAWKLNDLADTERAYHSALNASIQITWRRPWHLYRLASLLASTGRPSEALPFQEEGVRLSDYYLYSDNLAVLYAQLGEKAKAQSFCARARVLAGASQHALRCEGP